MTLYKKPQQTTPQTIAPNPWKEREIAIEKMVSAYMQFYTSSSMLWQEAVRDGVELDLWRFVHGVATVQAQMIHGDKIGWSRADIFGVNSKIGENGIRAWMHEQKRITERGSIDVSIPTGRIAEWKKTSA